MVHKPTGRLWEEEDESCEDGCRDDLDTKRNAPLPIIGVVLDCAVGSIRGGSSSETNEQLLQTSQSPTDRWVSDFGLVQRNDHGYHADTTSCAEAAAKHVTEVLSRGLQSASKAEDERANYNGSAAAELIGDETGKSSTTECSSGEDGDDRTAVTGPRQQRSASLGSESSWEKSGTYVSLAEGLLNVFAKEDEPIHPPMTPRS